MPRKIKNQTAVLAEPSEETPLWKLLQQVKEQVEACELADDTGAEMHEEHEDMDAKEPEMQSDHREMNADTEEPEMQPDLGEVNADTEEPETQKDPGQTNDEEMEPADTAEITPVYEDKDIAVMANDANGHSLTCYLSMLYAYGDLINKAMQQTWFISEQFITFMVKLSARYKEEGEDYSAQDFRKAISIYLSENPDDLRGIRMEDSEIIFEGFSGLEEDTYLTSYHKFLQMLERASHTCRINPSRNVHESEKFDMYQLLQKMHAGGEDNRMMRKRMTQRLSGHTAFANDTAKAKWEKRHGKKKKPKTKRKSKK